MFLYFKICNNILLLATERLLKALKVEIIILWVFNHVNMCSLLTLLPLNTRLCRFLQRFRYLELKLNIVFSTQAEPLHFQMFVTSFNICMVVKLTVTIPSTAHSHKVAYYYISHHIIVDFYALISESLLKCMRIFFFFVSWLQNSLFFFFCLMSQCLLMPVECFDRKAESLMNDANRRIKWL